MLAQNFKRPTDLQITEAEFEALVKLLNAFERGEIIEHQFDMGQWHCGTAGCIGGWCDELFGTRFGKQGGGAPIDHLFFPSSRPWGEIRTANAAIALRNFLTFGEPRWHEAMAG